MSTETTSGAGNELAAGPKRPGFWGVVVGTLALALALGASLALSLDHLGAIKVPGCGAASPCARAASSAWGSVPGVKLPVSFVGAAFFAGMLAAWTRGRGRLGLMARLAAVVGGAVSVMYLVVMGVERLWCPWCAASHAGNLVFVGTVVWGAWRPSPRASAGLGAVAAALVGMIALGTLVVAEGRTTKAVRAAEGKQLEESVRRIEGAARPQGTPVGGGVTAPAASGAGAGSAPVVGGAAGSGAPGVPAALAGGPAFTGRYRWGPERASIRIVMFTGYQCPDCKQVDQQVMEILKRRADVSLSLKQFPLSSDCNRHMQGANPHPNGCWAARAAEAAGMLAGNEGFQRMSAWLFARGGAFTSAAIREALPGLGFEVERFLEVMRSDETLRRVERDIEEGVSLGLMQTPMIFVNGYELTGWRATPTAVADAVERVAAMNLPAAGAEGDRPMGAAEKYVNDWRMAPNMAWPSRRQPWTAVSPEAPVQVQVWGDYLEPGTADIDARVRGLIAGRTDVRYEFRYYPLEQACNPHVPRTFFAGSCRAVRAAEAAGKLGGEPAYWAMHQWLMTNQKGFSDEALRSAAPGMGLNPEVLLATMGSPEITAIIDAEVAQGQRLGMPTVPRVFVNGRPVARWDVIGQPNARVLERILEEAPALGR